MCGLAGVTTVFTDTLESLPDEFVTRSAAPGTPVSLLRAEHRRRHLDEIEAALR